MIEVTRNLIKNQLRADKVAEKLRIDKENQDRLTIDMNDEIDGNLFLKMLHTHTYTFTFTLLCVLNNSFKCCGAVYGTFFKKKSGRFVVG